MCPEVSVLFFTFVKSSCCPDALYSLGCFNAASGLSPWQSIPPPEPELPPVSPLSSFPSSSSASCCRSPCATSSHSLHTSHCSTASDGINWNSTVRESMQKYKEAPFRNPGTFSMSLLGQLHGSSSRSFWGLWVLPSPPSVFE